MERSLGSRHHRRPPEERERRTVFGLDVVLKGLAGLNQVSSRLRKKGKALSRSVWSLNCLGGIRHVIVQFE